MTAQNSERTKKSRNKEIKTKVRNDNLLKTSTQIINPAIEYQKEKFNKINNENENLKTENAEYKIMYENVVMHAAVLDNELEKKVQEITKVSSTDFLTKIFNRKKLYESFLSEIERKKRYHADFSITMFDIDHFKQINDNHGHDNGDIVLVETVQLVQSLIRSTDIFGRLGGDEFIILMPNTVLSVARKMVERIKKRIEEKFKISIDKVTCSFGVTKYNNNETMKDCLIRADKALYKAKNSGRNKVAMFQ